MRLLKTRCNEYYLDRTGEERGIRNDMIKRRSNLSDRIVPHDGISKAIIEGYIEVKRSRERSKLEYRNQIGLILLPLPVILQPSIEPQPPSAFVFKSP